MEDCKDRSRLTTPSWFLNLILGKVRKGRVLELGCGTGWLSEKMEGRGLEVVACDVDGERLKIADERVNAVVRCDVKNLPFPEESFKAVVGIEVIEHIQKPRLLIKEAHRILKKEGLLFLKTPNRITHDIYQALQGRLEKSRNWHPSVMTHLELEEMLESKGFEAEFLKGGLLESQKEKIGQLFSHLLTFLPFEKLPLFVQPSIYVVAKKV